MVVMQMCQDKEINFLSATGKQITSYSITGVFRGKDSPAVNEERIFSREHSNRLPLPYIDNGEDSFLPVILHLCQHKKCRKRNS